MNDDGPFPFALMKGVTKYKSNAQDNIISILKTLFKSQCEKPPIRTGFNQPLEGFMRNLGAL